MSSFKIAIIGSGISGLAAAFRLQEMAVEKKIPLTIRLFEKKARAGGVIQSFFSNGFLLEAGPDSFIIDKPSGLQLCQKLNLDSQLIPTNPNLKHSFILKRNQLIPVPEGFFLLAPSKILPFMFSPLLPLSGKLRAGMEWMIPKRISDSDESIGSFVERRFGKDILENIAQPLISGIYNISPHELSLQACFPRFREMETHHGSILRSFLKSSYLPPKRVSGARYSLFLSFKQGMETLVTALVSKLSPSCFSWNTPIESIQRNSDRQWILKGPQKSITFDQLIIALPPVHAAPLFHSLHPDLSHLLQSMPSQEAATLNLAYPRASIHHPLDGFGFVVPEKENKHFSGCTFASRKFDFRSPESFELIRLFLSPRGIQYFHEHGETETINLLINEISQILHISGTPMLSQFHYHAQAMSPFRVGHLEKVKKIQSMLKKLPGIEICGNGFVGSGIPDCIHSGTQSAEKIIQSYG
jgi:oxygen-dependent protoporphyrinogen oxidase